MILQYRIGLFSKIGKTTVKTIRFYEEEGLLFPYKIDSESGYRYYSSTELIRLHEIMSLRQIGFSIQEIKKIFLNQEIDYILKVKRIEFIKQAKELQDCLSRLDHYINEREVQEKMNYQAVIKETPECIVFSRRGVVKNFQDYFQFVPEIGEMIKQANPHLKCSEIQYSFIIHYDQEYQDENMDIEYCEAVTEYGVETDEIKFKEIPSETVVGVLHKGRYEDFSFAYDFAYRWIEENGYEINGPGRESYIDGIWNKEDKEEWLTEIQIPIKKRLTT